MKNTAGIEIPRFRTDCRCGLTGGCEYCRPFILLPGSQKDITNNK